MKWKKLGQIFQFDKTPLTKIFESHSQSPQAVVFDSFIRVYFSTRTRDKTGKFLSHVQYVDYTRDFETILGFSNHEVIRLGESGCFDEHGIFPASPLKMNDKIYAYTTGWTRRKSVDVDSSIGLAISNDGGSTFIKHGDGPVLSTSLFEPFLVGDGFVRKYKDKYYMFYVFGERWCSTTVENSPQRVYKIGVSISDDGINWRKMNKKIITDVIDENECQALPTVVKIGTQYHMYFCFRHMSGFRTDSAKGYRLGYAFSDDLTTWQRDDSLSGLNPTEGQWDSDMMCYPHIFKVGNQIYMLYNGNEFGKHGFGLAILEGT